MRAAVGLLVLLVLAWFTSSTTVHAAGKTQEVNVVNNPGVNVLNTPTVMDGDNPARSPFAATGTGQFASEGHEVAVDLTTVPSGERLVVEQVSLEMQSDQSASDSQRIRAVLETTTGGTISQYAFAGIDGGVVSNFPNVEIFVASSRMRSYADAGTTVRVRVNRKTTSACPCPVSISLSGYLVDVP